MGWTTPQNWTAVPFTVSNLNTQIRDNLIALKDPPTGIYTADESSDYTTTSTTFTNVDGTDTEGKFRHTLDCNGGAIMVVFDGTVICSTGQRVYFDITVDGNRYFLDDGAKFVGQDAANDYYPTTMVRFLTGISAGSHVFRLQWKVTATGTGRIYAGAGTANADIHPQFFVREVS